MEDVSILADMQPRMFKSLTSAVQRRGDTLLELSDACKIAANTGIWPVTLFPAFQEINSGCCTKVSTNETR